jgi:hypothetical protein
LALARPIVPQVPASCHPQPARHTTRSLDVAFHLQTGPRANIGPITIVELKELRASVIHHDLLLHATEQDSTISIENASQDLMMPAARRAQQQPNDDRCRPARRAHPVKHPGGDRH